MSQALPSSVTSSSATAALPYHFPRSKKEISLGILLRISRFLFPEELAHMEGVSRRWSFSVDAAVWRLKGADFGIVSEEQSTPLPKEATSSVVLLPKDVYKGKFAVVRAGAFGPSKWKQHFGIAVKAAPPFPLAFYKAACSTPWPVKATLLVEGVTLSKLVKLAAAPLKGTALVSGITTPLSNVEEIIADYGESVLTPQAKWVLVEAREERREKEVDLEKEQEAPPATGGWRSFHLMEAATSLIVHYVASGKFLWKIPLTRCQEKKGNSPVAVGVADFGKLRPPVFRMCYLTRPVGEDILAFSANEASRPVVTTAPSQPRKKACVSCVIS